MYKRQDHIGEDNGAAFTSCDFLFLCAPVSQNDSNLLLIRSFLLNAEENSCILTDVGSVKATIHEHIEQLGLTSCFIGGHPMAAGITLKPENIEAFRKRINQYAAEHFPQMPTQTVTLDCKLNPAALSVSMAQSLTQLEPFGNGNPQPVFGLFNMEISNVTPVGGGGHLRLTLEKNGAVITAMRFNTKPEELPYHIGDKIDLAVQLEAREFRGQPSLTVIVRDMKFAAFNTEKNIASLASFEKWQRGEVLSAEDKNRLYPDRACLAAIYRALRTVNGKETDQVRFVSQFGKDMTLGLFKTALLVFEERGLVHSEIADDTFTATLIETSGKTDITRSPVLLALQ